MEMHLKPALARGCKLRESDGEAATLQIPEGMLKMSGAGVEIVKLCDGSNTVEGILTSLKSRYPEPAHARIESETIGFLDRLRRRLVLEFK